MRSTVFAPAKTIGRHSVMAAFLFNFCVAANRATGGVAASVPIDGGSDAAARPAPTPPIAAPSSFALVEVHVKRAGDRKGSWVIVDAGLSGPSRIGDFSVRGAGWRGAARSKGEPFVSSHMAWRFGANMAATLHTQMSTLTLGTLQVAEGGDLLPYSSPMVEPAEPIVDGKPASGHGEL